jgi:hypothetical protein
MRRTSRTESREDVAAACCCTAALSSAFSCSPTGLLGGEDVPGLRYRAAEDMVVVLGGADVYIEVFAQDRR